MIKDADLQKNTEGFVQKEYSRLVQDYDKRWKFYVTKTLQKTLKRIRIQPDQSLLDIGCGTGILLEVLEKKYPGIVLAGVDPTGEMLDIAKERLSEKVTLKQSRAENLPFEDSTFDVIVSCNMFHYIQEPTVALKEMMRILKPKGRVVITDWCDDYLSCRMYDLFLRKFKKIHFKTYGRKEFDELLLSAGYIDIKVDRYKTDWLWGMMTAMACKQAN